MSINVPEAAPVHPNTSFKACKTNASPLSMAIFQTFDNSLKTKVLILG